MLPKSFTSPVFTFEPYYISLSVATSALTAIVKPKVSHGTAPKFHIAEIKDITWLKACASKKWKLSSTAETQTVSFSDEESKMWEACRGALKAFGFSIEEEDKILGKAFGHVHSPYWGEERAKNIPRSELVHDILAFLRSLGLSDDELGKLLKKFPEVLGCSLSEELRNNVQVLEDTWGIKGKYLRNLLLRNPKVLGYNVDCKGDCIAKCTRCWARF